MNNLNTYYFKIGFITLFLIILQGCSKEDLKDTDGDGVIDTVDECPNTPSYERIHVNDNGCSESQRDTDGDGVMDDLDKCPDTPPDERIGVNDNGCSESQRDTDGDLVMDNIDECPNTPPYERIGVDNNGCSDSQKDTDSDGVMDDLDECPETPNGESVGSRGCKIIIDNGDGITFEFIDGLNDDERYKLPKDENGYYYLTLDGFGQTTQRITVKLSRNGDVVYSSYEGYSHNLEWSSNLYWWILPGDVVYNITQSYFNLFTGEFQYINLPPLVNWEEQLVSIVNPSSYTDEDTGIGNTVIGPIQEMLGDTLIISVRYKYKSILFKDSINIILK